MFFLRYGVKKCLLQLIKLKMYSAILIIVKMKSFLNADDVCWGGNGNASMAGSTTANKTSLHIFCKIK